MRMTSREKLPGTDITIGKRRTGDRTYGTWSCEYTDPVDGKRKCRALGTRNKQAAIRGALEIQARIEAGRPEQRFTRLRLTDLVEQFMAYCRTKGLAAKSIAKYGSESDKLMRFLTEDGVIHADRFDERAYYRYRAWLSTQAHKQGSTYSEKSIESALLFVRQALKWGWRSKLLPAYELAGTPLPKAKARPQPCPTTEQVEAIIGRMDGIHADAVAILAYSGLRVGELTQLCWQDVLLDRGDLGVLHVRRGGSNGRTKDKDDRVVPIHPRIRPVIGQLPRDGALVLPGLRDRTLLAKLKRAARASGAPAGLKTHSLRHHFASMCANSSVPYRMAMAWMGHSSSSILDLYYHLHDEDSQAAMMILGRRA